MAICRMRVQSDVGEEWDEFRVGNHWDEIANDFEKSNPGTKVKEVSGLRPISSAAICLNDDDRQILQAALQRFVLEEWRFYCGSTGELSKEALQRYKRALNLLLSMGA